MSATNALIKESFTIMDKDSDGSISPGELLYALRFIGVTSNYNDLYKKDNINYSLKEYSKIAKKQLGLCTPKQKMIQTLKKIDKNKSGQLSVDTLIFLVMTMSDFLSDEDYNSFKKFIDPENKKVISIEEFADKVLS
ncbi:calmodulin, putative [Plasmodium ovale wallikeri]|uniref:Calmodulin, putative n=2 Tax=Plasmodium ovale TaxID=36330 RepID=A0A1A8ZP99_PLAOA|nr:calmodulin, putative [Plasmodium ovale wallikeri]SBT46254.1 calmodulin, putative [Plasmodium ovale wallikeri]SBT78883.1 calmodulin, putative [Plasmodium ovale]